MGYIGDEPYEIELEPIEEPGVVPVEPAPVREPEKVPA